MEEEKKNPNPGSKGMGMVPVGDICCRGHRGRRSRSNSFKDIVIDRSKTTDAWERLERKRKKREGFLVNKEQMGKREHRQKDLRLLQALIKQFMRCVFLFLVFFFWPRVFPHGFRTVDHVWMIHTVQDGYISSSYKFSHFALIGVDLD